MVERVAAVVLLVRLAGTVAGGRLHFEGARIADAEDTADDSHCSSDCEKPGTAAAIEWPWQVYRAHRWYIE